MEPHPDWEELKRLWPDVEKFQRLASKHGVRDIFQDNGGKLLQLLLVTGLTCIASREGNDARDCDGNEFELKTVNQQLTQSFSTHHHLNPTILRKYRAVRWVFAIYHGIELRAVYLMTPEKLEPYFSKWEAKWNLDHKDINNPKIPIAFVVEHGDMLFSGEPEQGKDTVVPQPDV